MMDPFNKSSYVRNVNVGNYTRVHYDTKEDNARQGYSETFIKQVPHELFNVINQINVSLFFSM